MGVLSRFLELSIMALLRIRVTYILLIMASYCVPSFETLKSIISRLGGNDLTSGGEKRGRQSELLN